MIDFGKPSIPCCVHDKVGVCPECGGFLYELYPGQAGTPIHCDTCEYVVEE